MNYPVLALAHHRLGHAAEARHWLEKSKQEWRRLSPLLRSSGSLTVLPHAPPHWWRSNAWHDWPTFEVLFREASLVIAGSVPVEDAFDHSHRSLIYSRLGKLEKAEAEWQTAVKMAPREPMIWLTRARQFIESKHSKEAEAALATAAEFASNDPHVWKERGRLFFELGRTDKAAADFGKALKLLGNQELSDEPIISEADKLFNRLELTAFIEQNPEDMVRRRKRGERYARHWRWQEAAADYKMALERNPPGDAVRWLDAAPALAVGDPESYRWMCREMKKRFGNTQDHTTAERIAKASLLLPELTKEVQWACTLADRAVERGKDHRFLPYYLLCKGLADYRRENYRAAIEGIDPLVTVFANDTSLLSLCHLVLALAYHRQNDAKAARHHLAQAGKLLDQHLPDPARSPASVPQFNHDLLIAWLLRREAKELIEGKKAEPNK
jgi:tetratricopeptide (TPR) repeat protein